MEHTQLNKRILYGIIEQGFPFPTVQCSCRLLMCYCSQVLFMLTGYVYHSQSCCNPTFTIKPSFVRSKSHWSQSPTDHHCTRTAANSSAHGQSLKCSPHVPSWNYQVKFFNDPPFANLLAMLPLLQETTFRLCLTLWLHGFCSIPCDLHQTYQWSHAKNSDRQQITTLGHYGQVMVSRLKHGSSFYNFNVCYSQCKATSLEANWRFHK